MSIRGILKPFFIIILENKGKFELCIVFFKKWELWLYMMKCWIIPFHI